MIVAEHLIFWIFLSMLLIAILVVACLGVRYVWIKRWHVFTYIGDSLLFGGDWLINKTKNK